MKILYSIINRTKNRVLDIKTKIKWKIRNKNNYTSISGTHNIEKITVGKFTYGKINAKTFGSDEENLKIGAYCSIADNVVFILGGEHNYKYISTYPFKVKCNKEHCEAMTKGKIEVGNDVWIGYGAIILSGVRIGQGAIIGAGSIVSKDIPPYAIYANGKIIKYRFPEKIIEELKKMDYSLLKKEQITNNIDYLYTELNEENYKDIINKIGINAK